MTADLTAEQAVEAIRAITLSDAPPDVTFERDILNICDRVRPSDAQPEALDQEALANVPAGTVVRAADGSIAARYDVERGVVFGDDRPFPWSVLRAPATILWPTPAYPPAAPALDEDRDDTETTGALDLACREVEATHHLQHVNGTFVCTCREFRSARARSATEHVTSALRAALSTSTDDAEGI